MSNDKKRYIWFVLGIALGMAIIIYANYDKLLSEDLIKTDVAKEILVLAQSPPYELSLVEDDLKTYNHLSENTRQEILDSLYGAYKRFKVPIGLMHAVTRTESEYKFWLTHPTVTVSIYKKGKKERVTTNALGMGGVIWEIWGDTLKHFNVAYEKSDLYKPGIGITAQACVLHLIIEDVMNDNTAIPNIVARIQSKYYGAYAKEYIARMKLVTSDLWIKRIAKEIDYVYNMEEATINDTLEVAYNNFITEDDK